VKKGVLLTPPISDGVLEGITRDSVMTIARDQGVEVQERSLVRTDLYTADEMFMTGSAAEVVPVRAVDGRVIGDPGPVTIAVQKAFFDAVSGKDPAYSSWLEHV
jgi:branched chain amino acid aminotransferase apoenzyme (EC 2.6.1.42)